MKRNEQLELARNLGAAHFAAGGRCTPVSDRKVLALLEGRALGVTPEGEAPTVLILKAWSDGWTVANLRGAA
jgi:hypothetical protein